MRAPACGVIILDNDEENRKKGTRIVFTYFFLHKQLVQSGTSCIIRCVPKQKGFQTQNAKVTIPSKSAHMEEIN